VLKFEGLSREQPRDRLLLFELGLSGHRPGYLQHLVRFWNERNLAGVLNVVVRPEFIHRYPDIVDLATKSNRGQVNFVPLTDAEEAETYLADRANSKALNFREWALLAKYADRLNASHSLIMYFDFMQLPAAQGNPIGCPFSGIYFRPTFHYNTFEFYQPAWSDRFQQWREKAILSWVLQHSQLQTLFCLDQFATDQFDSFHSSAEVVYLPDPVQIYPESTRITAQLRQQLGIDPDRKVFLLFGELSDRKGLSKLLSAIALLSPIDCQKLCLLLVGPIAKESQPLIRHQVSRLSDGLPIQMIIHDQFVTDSQIQPYFQLADVILAPYQRHVGMSAILVRAATAQKPVLSCNYGLMGELTHRHRLGLAVDAAQPEQLANGIRQFLRADPVTFCDRQKMQQWASQNTAEKFASTIFNHITTAQRVAVS
jgi:glycosyltransferase involved in cell wall biosynthesis